MLHLFRSFLRDERGAVTVDWVVLTASLVGLSLAVMAVVWIGFDNQTTNLQQFLARDHIYSTFAEADALADQDSKETDP